MQDDCLVPSSAAVASASRRRVLRSLAGVGALTGAGAVTRLPDAVARELSRDRAMPAPIAGIVPPRGTGGPLPLLDTSRRPFDFGRLAGGYGLLTFGFTRCETSSPVSLAQARELLDAMPATAAPLVIFVTLDPLADTPEALGAWLHRRDPRILGLTGEPSRVDRVVQAYRVGLRQGPAGLEHGPVWYLIDPAGDTVRVYPLSAGVERIVADIRSIRSARA